MKKIPGIKKIGYSLLDLPKIKLFSLLATVIFFIYYLISGQKHGAYLIPAYPFIAIFLAQYILYLTEYKTKVTKVFSVFITFLGCIAGLICILSIITHVINPVEIVDLFIDHVETLSDIALIWSSFTLPRLLYVILFVLLVFALYFSCYQLTKKNNLKILYATIGVCFAINLIIDGIISPSYKNKVSAKPIAKDILESFPEKSSRIYVMNNPYEYSNMYGLNYYLNNSFKNFEKILPESGLLLIGQESFYKMMKIYNENYNFVKLKQYENRAKDGEKIICIYSIEKLK